MLSARPVFNHPKLFQSWQPSGLPEERGGPQQVGLIELPVVSDYSQLRDHQTFNAIQTQFLNEVCELKQLAHAYVNEKYDEAIDTFVAKLKAPADHQLANLLPIYRGTRFQIHQLVGRLKGYQQDGAHNQQNICLKDYIASVLHDCLDGIDLCLAGVHSRFSRSSLDLETVVHGGLASTFYQLRSDLFREFIQAFLWQNQREGKISIAWSVEVHWFNALYNLCCHDLALPPIDDPLATISLPDKLLSPFLQRVPVSVNACVMLRRMVDGWGSQLTEALAAVGCSHWLNEPTSSNENTAIGVDALISRVFNPVNSLMGTATDNPLNLDAVMDLCDNESFHLKRHREKMLAWLTGYLYPNSTEVFAEVLVCGRAKAYIGSINDLFFWVFDHDQLLPGQVCGFTADRHTSLKLTHLLSIDFSSWPASTGHALLTQAMEQTDEPDEIVAFFLDCNVTAQLNAMPQPVSQALSNQLRDKLLRCTGTFRDVLCQKVCSYFVRCGIKTASGHVLGWLIDTPLLEPVLLGLSRQGVNISPVVQGLNSWQISDWSGQCLGELLPLNDCQRLFSQAFGLCQGRVLAFLLLTGYCDLQAYSLTSCFFNEFGQALPRRRELLISLFARHGELAGLQYLLSLIRRWAPSTSEESYQAQVAEISQRYEGGLTPLMKAAMYGNADCLQELLNVSGVDVNMTNDEDFTPLHLAAMRGQAQSVRVLLQTGGVAVNKKALAGATPLNMAVLGGRLDLVRMLLAHTSIAVNEDCHDGLTPLHYAVRDGHTEIMQALLAMPGIDVNARNNGGWTPLNCAARKGSTSCVRALLATPGIDVNARDNNGWTPLNAAAYTGFTDCIRALLAVPGIDANGRNNNGWAPLISAVSKGSTSCVRALLATPGIDVNVRDNNGWTPLNAAADRGFIDCIRALLAVPGIDANARNDHGWTPLNIAASKGFTSCVQALLTMADIDANASNSHGGTPLNAAAYEGFTGCVRALLNVPGILVNGANSDGRSPLSNAAREGHSDCVRLLSEASGIDVNHTCSKGMTPLHYATRNKHWGCVQALLRATDIKVNLLTSDGNGHFALGIAAEQGDLQSLRILLAASGIEINKSGPSGDTALYLAALNGHAQCVEALLQVGGVDSDSRNRLKQSPLDLAIQGGFRECIELLQRSSLDQ